MNKEIDENADSLDTSYGEDGGSEQYTAEQKVILFFVEFCIPY